MVRAPEAWDRAEGAGMVAALRHAQVGSVAGCQPMAVPLRPEGDGSVPHLPAGQGRQRVSFWDGLRGVQVACLRRWPSKTHVLPGYFFSIQRVAGFLCARIAFHSYPKIGWLHSTCLMAHNVKSQAVPKSTQVWRPALSAGALPPEQSVHTRVKGNEKQQPSQSPSAPAPSTVCMASSAPRESTGYP